MSKQALLASSQSGGIGILSPRLGYDDDDKLDDAARQARRKLLTASGICLVFMVVEIIGGFWAGSLALLTDALHLMSDLASNLIGLFALWLLTKRGTPALSFGYHRAEILGAVLSVLMVWGITVWLVWEAILRLRHPQPVDGKIMSITAAIGLVANLLISCVLGLHSHGIAGVGGGGCSHDHGHGHTKSPHPLWSHKSVPSPLLGHDAGARSARATYKSPNHPKHGSDHEEGETHGHHHHDHHHHDHDHHHHDHDHPHDHDHSSHGHGGSNQMNVRAAYIHAIGDLIQSIGVLIAGLVIWWKPHYIVVDPICTFFFSVLVLWTTIGIIIEATQVLMEGSPSGVDCTALLDDLKAIDGVIDIHDLHVWSLTVGTPALAAHIVASEEQMARRILEAATSICQDKHAILHTTIQIDYAANVLQCGTKAHRKCHSKRRPIGGVSPPRSDSN